MKVGAKLPVESVAAAAPEAPKDARSGEAAKRADACREFEAIFVRSMLAESGIGKRGDGAYGDLAVNALAGAITAGGGLGLGDAIRRALELHDRGSRNSGEGR